MRESANVPKRLRAMVLWGAGAASCGGQAAASCPGSPDAAARMLYEQHYGFYRADAGGSAPLAPALRSLLVRDWQCQAPGEVCALGADPWVNAQDGDIHGPIRYVAGAHGARHATVWLHYRFGITAASARQVATRLDLERDPVSSCWLLEDVTGPGGESLRKTLRQFDGYRTP
ncbi:hypothetical protein [Tahibacter amnicola]|uniref:Uncharacterized protein n=1 Tax=Tahibacter amnicola TaxID=2976241 RepID=A0ABY6BEZ1_9GAMM|nr:hypothetical protein [Tahibacter amnicola]UXI68598.1 hypothetical protein N4264_02810 [Tahibacter amnicola]